MDAETHDRWVCATSHLPYLISNALAAVTPIEAAPLVGPGFRSTARLAPSTPEMMLDILTTNRTNLLEAVTLYRQRLDELDAALNTNDTELLKRLLMDGGEKYDRVIRKDVESHAD
jgi:prephenate dehydrogenase